MTRKIVGIAAMLTVLTMAGASLVAGSMLPADIQLPIHWGLSGEPDRFAGKWFALLAPAAMIGLVSLLFYFLPALEPRKEGLARSQGLYLWGWIGLLLMGAVIELALLSNALGWGIHTMHLMAVGTGILLMLIGNQLGKSRSMYLIGVRTPWTLASEEVWIRTHRLCGKLMVGGGLLILVTALLPVPSGVLAAVSAVVIMISAGVPILYSFILWRREARSEQTHGGAG
jgi:uncharacterized membrane protein